MRLLVDTHALIYALVRPDVLRGETRAALVDAAHEVYFSAASIWEIEIKAALGKLARPPGDVAAEARAQGFTELVITSEHAVRAARLPPHHRDPFDRMLVAQAQQEGLTLVTDDALVAAYEVAVLPC